MSRWDGSSTSRHTSPPARAIIAANLSPPAKTMTAVSPPGASQQTTGTKPSQPNRRHQTSTANPPRPNRGKSPAIMSINTQRDFQQEGKLRAALRSRLKDQWSFQIAQHVLVQRRSCPTEHTQRNGVYYGTPELKVEYSHIRPKETGPSWLVIATRLRKRAQLQRES